MKITWHVYAHQEPDDPQLGPGDYPSGYGETPEAALMDMQSRAEAQALARMEIRDKVWNVRL